MEYHRSLYLELVPTETKQPPSSGGVIRKIGLLFYLDIIFDNNFNPTGGGALFLNIKEIFFMSHYFQSELIHFQVFFSFYNILSENSFLVIHVIGFPLYSRRQSLSGLYSMFLSAAPASNIVTSFDIQHIFM